jgi:hypothetical protein
MTQRPSGPNSRPARDPRTLALGAAAIIVGYALVVAGIAAGLIGDLVYDDAGPPPPVPRPLVLGALLMLPAAIAAIGAVRGCRPLLIAAGVLCLAQSFVAFSGVTIPFVVPAVLLLALGIRASDVTTARRAVVGSVLVLALGFGAWIAPFASTETSCWTAQAGSDGTVTYTRVPATDNAITGPTFVASGCGGGQLTIAGVGLSMLFAAGAIVMAAVATTPLERRRTPAPTPV